MERRQSSVVETALEVRDHVLERLSAVPVQAETLRESRPSKVSTENLEIGFESGRINSIQGFQSISTMKSSRYIHEDGIRRSGNTLTACGHIITAVIGAGVLAMPVRGYTIIDGIIVIDAHGLFVELLSHLRSCCNYHSLHCVIEHFCSMQWPVLGGSLERSVSLFSLQLLFILLSCWQICIS